MKHQNPAKNISPLNPFLIVISVQEKQKVSVCNNFTLLQSAQALSPVTTSHLPVGLQHWKNFWFSLNTLVLGS